MENSAPNDNSSQQSRLSRKPPVLLIMVGIPGTGKSHLVRLLSRRVPLQVIQTDEIRKRLFARPAYTQEENRRVFLFAHREINRLLAAGENVAFDATNLYESRRRALYRMAERNGARLLIVRTVAPDDVVAERLQIRSLGNNPEDLSDAGWEVYARMKAEYQEIGRPYFLVDTSRPIEPDVDRLAELIEAAE